MPEIRDEVIETIAGPTRLRVVGGDGPRPPLVLLHGGPGLTWDYLEEFDALASQGFPVIYYDQLGSGGSSATPADAVTLERLLTQLEAVLADTVGGGAYALLAHSAGSILGLEHALRRPAGLARMILANGYAASAHAAVSIARHARSLPPEQAAAIAASAMGEPAYAAATGTFYSRHVFRVPPSPGLQRTFAALAENPGVGRRLWGADVFHLTGQYAGWDVVDRLGELDLPVLVYRGEHDETGFECMDPIMAALPHARGMVVPDASHVPHMERPDVTLRLVRDFLSQT